MRARRLRFALVSVLALIAFVPMLPSRALGTATLTGAGRFVCSSFDPTCEFEDPIRELFSIVYDAQAPAANTLTFTDVPGIDGVQACVPEEGPFECGNVFGGTSEQYTFTEVFAKITGEGFCAGSGRQASCWGQAPAVLPVTIRTKALNDQVTITGVLSHEFAFTIDTGDGNDVVTLTNAPRLFDSVVGPDTITCGAGNDRVTATLDVAVAADCETVERV